MNKVTCLLSASLFGVLSLGCAITTEPLETITEEADGRPDPDKIPINISEISDAIPQYEHWSPSINPSSYSVLGKDYQILKTNKGYTEQGIASWYGTKFHEQKTATGEAYNMFAMTAAHKTLPIPSYVRVTNLDNQASIIVKVNDHGPFHEHRIIDLSYVAAVKLGIDKTGTGFVEVTAVHPDETEVPRGAINAKQFYMQVGAFSERVNAKKLQKRLAAEISTPKIRIKQQKYFDKILYSVQIGPILSVDEADQLKQKLNSLAIIRTQVISE
jgi:rare lipoprotein A